MQEENVKKEAPKVAQKTSEDYFASLDLAKLDLSIQEMLKNGVHFGHKKAKRHPAMEQFIWATRSGVNIIDLQSSFDLLNQALDFVKSVVISGKKVLFVGTKKQAKKLVKSAAQKCDMPYVDERWLGGTFTNFEVISKRTRYLRENLDALSKGDFKRYTKFEQMKKKEELEKMEKKMGGIKYMTELPGAVIALDAKENIAAIKEAKRMGIPIVALVDTNVDPNLIDHPIPSNDDAVSAIKLMLGYFAKAVSEAKAGVNKPDKEDKDINKHS